MTPFRSRGKPAQALAGLLLALAVSVAACGGGSSSTSSRTIDLPYMGAITGSFAAVGAPIGNSVQLAVEQAKSKLAAKGITLNYQPQDDQMDPAQSPQVARKIITDANVLAIVGPMFGIDLNAAAPILTEAGIAFLTPGASAAVLSTHGWTMFRMIPNDDTQGTVGANYIMKVFKWSKVAVIDDGTQYGHGVALVAAKLLKDGGVTLTDVESVDANAIDFSATVAKIIASGAEGVYMGASITVQYTFNRQLHEKGFKGGYVAPDGALNPDFPAKAGPGAEGAIITCQCAPVPAYGGPNTGPLADYVTAYKAKFGSEPQAYSPEGFDAANLIIAGIMAGKTDRASLLAYVKSANFQGIAKGYSFQANGELNGTSMHIYQVKAGKIQWLGLSDQLIK